MDTVSRRALPPDLICLSVDVEWASPEVLADTVRLLDEHALRATFFCTHAGVEVPGHERGLHPNFRCAGETVRALRATAGAGGSNLTDTAVYEHVVRTTRAFCPEAVGVRAHSLFYESDLLPIYRQAGIEYDSSYFLPLAAGLRPMWKECGILEIPIHYMDHCDLAEQATGFRLDGLGLGQPGLKVLDFHPNLIFLNAATTGQYLASKPHYHDADRLRRLRHPGRGVRTLFIELLDAIAGRGWPTATLAEMNAAMRAGADSPTDSAVAPRGVA